MQDRDLDRHSTKLEDAFFAKKHAELLDQFRRKTSREQQKDQLREVVKIHDEAFINRLIALEIRPQTALAIRLIPLILVAWADGQVDERERKALLDAASHIGVTAQSQARTLLENGLATPPDPKLLTLWKAYVGRLFTCFTSNEQLLMRHNLLQSTREVAEAAGGFLGLTSKISAAERAVLEELEQVVT